MDQNLGNKDADNPAQLVELVRANAERVNKASGERSNFVAELIDRSRAIESEIAGLLSQSESTQNELQLTADAAQQIIAEVENIVGLLDQTLTGIADLDQRISDFEDSFRDVRTISKTIEDVAKQTNILSLNAMIEAAHAGENGHGFKVVANEVRELASMTGASAHDISQNISQLVADAEQMSDDCAKLRALSGQGADKGKANLAGLRKVHEDVLTSASDAQSANRASGEQISQFASLLMSMEDLQRDTEAAIEGSAQNMELAARLEACIDPAHDANSRS